MPAQWLSFQDTFYEWSNCVHTSRGEGYAYTQNSDFQVFISPHAMFCYLWCWATVVSRRYSTLIGCPFLDLKPLFPEAENRFRYMHKVWRWALLFAYIFVWLEIWYQFLLYLLQKIKWYNEYNNKRNTTYLHQWLHFFFCFASQNMMVHIPSNTNKCA